MRQSWPLPNSSTITHAYSPFGVAFLAGISIVVPPGGVPSILGHLVDRLTS